MVKIIGDYTRQEFDNWVHEALKYLYDSTFLEDHPLGLILAEEKSEALRPSQALRQKLLGAIRSLHPNAPDQSPDWRMYRVLELRYIDGLTYNEVMQHLNIGKSQYFREQARALEALTDILWRERRIFTPPVAPSAASDRQTQAQAEVEHLIAQARWGPVALLPLINELRLVIERLVGETQTQVSFDLPADIFVLQADRVMLRQTILNMLTVAVDLAPDGRIEFQSFIHSDRIGIRILARTQIEGIADGYPAEREGVGLKISEGLARAIKGELTVRPMDRSGWEATLMWPRENTPSVLVIDDNEGVISLIRRYLADSPWEVIDAASGEIARQKLSHFTPLVIILDVMMPTEDGWEWLMKIKADPAYRAIPVIICSVLNEPKLAARLGAADYLLKPVTQANLLSVLNSRLPDGASLAPMR